MSARILTLPLTPISITATAPDWATPARTAVTPVDADGAVATYESAPVSVATTGSPDALVVAVVVEDYVDGRGPALAHNRDVYVQVGWDLLTVEQSRFLVAAVEAAVEAAEAAGGAS